MPGQAIGMLVIPGHRDECGPPLQGGNVPGHVARAAQKIIFFGYGNYGNRSLRRNPVHPAHQIMIKHEVTDDQHLVPGQLLNVFAFQSVMILLHSGDEFVVRIRAPTCRHTG
jgi:hypothetical protein